MKSVPAVANAIKTGHQVEALPELIIDWNMNRYVGAVANNTPLETDENYDAELFPVESIVEPNRPNKGINKARVGSSVIGDDYKAPTGNAVNGRFYIADVDDTYKYWTSPVPSDTSGVLTKTAPFVIYNTDIFTNKIVINTENTWASAKTFKVYVTTQANPSTGVTGWTEIASETTAGNWKASGKMVFYWNGSWSAGSRVDNADKTPKYTTIRGIKIVVTSLEGGYKTTTDGSLVPTTYSVSGSLANTNTTGKESFFDLISISAHLEVDISDYIITVDDNFDLGENSDLYPIGTVTSNQATITLSNLYEKNGVWKPGLFSANNADSPYRNYIDANAEVTLSYNYYDASHALIGKVPQFKMYTETWTSQSEDEVSVDCTDFSKFFDAADAKLRAAMWENLSVPEIFYRILDSVGYNNYRILSDSERVSEHIIPVFYTDGESTVWQVLSELGKAAQAAIYFDGFGRLQIKTRDFALSSADAPVWDFTNVDTTTPADIVNTEIETEYEPNYYKVMYQKTNWSAANRGLPSMQQVWEPEGTLTLRASPLLRTMERDSTYIWMEPAVTRYWPYEGLVNIQGELIRYKGKVFVYYTGPGEVNRKTVLISSEDEFKTRNAKTPINLRHKNFFTGSLRIIERGVWNSETRRHPVEAEGYSIRQIVNGNRNVNVGGFKHDKLHSRVQMLSGPAVKNGKDLKIATRGDTDDTPFFNYGTRFRMLKDVGKTTQRVGLVIHNSGVNEDGFYFDFIPSKNISGKKAAARDHEFLFIARIGGKETILDKARCAIGENIDYELDIEYTPLGGPQQVRVWLNGKMISNTVVSGANRVAANGKFGMYIRGKTRAEFEYLYAIRREEEPKLLEDFSFLDKVERGYTGGQWDREWVYGWKKYGRRKKKRLKDAGMRFNRQFFDEFGPIVHEVREFDVSFEPAPVLHSRLYLTNDWSGCVIEYKANPFGAQFVVANTSRRNAVLNGEDTISFSGTGEAINQTLTVLGRPLITEEAEEVVAKNDNQIRRRGKNESEITSTWIQSKAMANDLAEWMNNHFSYGNDEITAEVFGNPLIEVGDIVTVNDTLKHISGQFFVLSARNEFSNGVITTLGLRRRV